MEGGGATRVAAAAVPTEDAVQALVDHLVFPLLPLRVCSREIPNSHQEEVVAKQMHAVVLLYNYYHRKQFPQLEFLGFESFCKLAVIARPSLLTYMKFIRRCKEDSGDLDNQLSTTERMVMDACNICTSLDASKDAPNMESWPVSKIAVFLIDRTKENCLLQFCAIIQGVWSLVEKDLDKPYDNLVRGQQMKKHTSKEKRAARRSSGDKYNEIDGVLHQLAFSAVKEKTGINQSNLSVLEHHMAYSLSQEKTTTRLYIIMYTEAVNEEFMEVPVKDVVSSLGGPLFKRCPTPEVTPVVEYYHLLPFIDILSDWLSRETPHVVSLHEVRPQADVDEKCLLEPNRKPTMEALDINDKSDWSEQTANILRNKTSKIEKKNINKKGDDPSLTGAGCRPSSITGDSSMELDRLPTTGVKGMNDTTFFSARAMGILSDGKNTLEKTDNNINGIGGSCTSGSTEAVCYKKADCSSLNHHQQLTPHAGDIKSRKNSISEAHIGRTEMTSNQVGAHVAVNGFKDETVMVDSVEKPYKKDSIDGDPIASTATIDAVQDRMATRDLPLVPVQFISEDHDTFQLVTSPKKNDLLQSSLRVLHKKLDELCQQQRLLGDEIAQCEMNIQTILDGREENMTSNIKLVIEACNNLCSTQTQVSTSLCFEERNSPQQIKRKRLSEAVLNLQSPCQELDGICRENSWILPRYCVLPLFADGRFQASVTVQGMDFEFTVRGVLKSSAREARESAASQVLSKLRSMADQAP